MTQLEKLKVYPSTGFLLPLPETGMWNYALENNHIKDIDHYLTQITERQDFSLNLTNMSQEQLKNETVNWLEKLNKSVGGTLDKEKLLKTGGYDEHSKHQNSKERKVLIDRNSTTRETLNYATQEGAMR